MVTSTEISNLGRQIAEQFRPDRIVPFGSYAWGVPREDSDVDLLVVMPHSDSSLGRAAAVARTIRAPYDVDIIVRTPDEIAQRLAWGDRFIGGIVENGRVLYESPDR